MKIRTKPSGKTSNILCYKNLHPSLKFTTLWRDIGTPYNDGFRWWEWGCILDYGPGRILRDCRRDILLYRKHLLNIAHLIFFRKYPFQEKFRHLQYAYKTPIFTVVVAYISKFSKFSRGARPGPWCFCLQRLHVKLCRPNCIPINEHSQQQTLHGGILWSFPPSASAFCQNVGRFLYSNRM